MSGELGHLALILAFVAALVQAAAGLATGAPPRLAGAAVRLHALALAGAFAYSGDTRPIPEQLARHAGRGERVFHDCSLEGNPSHAGLDDLAREYPDGLRARMVLYHYADEEAAAAMRKAGYEVAKVGKAYVLSEPADAARGPWERPEGD